MNLVPKKRMKRYERLFICDKDMSHTKPYRGEFAANVKPWLRCECGGAMNLVTKKLVDGQWVTVDRTHKKKSTGKAKPKERHMSLEQFAQKLGTLKFKIDYVDADGIWLRKIGRPGVRARTDDGKRIRIDQRVHISTIERLIAIRVYGAVGWGLEVKALAQRLRVPFSIRFFDPITVREGEKNGHDEQGSQ